MSSVALEQVKQMIEQLPSEDVEQLRVWLNSHSSNGAEPGEQVETWGQRVAAMIANFALEEGDQMAIDDPEAWVHERRRTRTNRRNPNWGEK